MTGPQDINSDYDHFENWDRPPQRKVGALADCQDECEPGECNYVPDIYAHADGSRECRPVADALLAALERYPRSDLCEPSNVLPEDDATRKLYPMAEGCLDYFPNALAEVSRISFEGNQKHNPGQPMHWARGKSTDHRNKIIRHTVDSVPETEAAIEHAAQAAWRSLAYLQEKIERVRGVPMSAGSRPA